MLKYITHAKSKAIETIAVKKTSRRAFLGGTAVFTLAAFATKGHAFTKWEHGGSEMPGGAVEDPLIFVSIDTDGTVTLVAHRSEMGQGARTSIPMVMADEMEADWSRVKIVQAEGDEARYGNQNTDGSRSLRHNIQAARKIGGSIRHMLQTAAAEKWGVDPSAVVIENHKARSGSNSADFGELAEAAMEVPVPAHEDIQYKSEDQFRYIGKGEVQIVDLKDITTGAAVYGADVSLPGMKVAVALRPPVVGGKIVSHNGEEVAARPGVVGVYELPHSIPPAGFAPLGGVAVVADNTWAALDARDALQVEWDDGPHGGYNTNSYMDEMKATALEKGTVLRTKGDQESAFANAAKIVGQTYSQDHVAHIPMEPPVALANFSDNKLEVWAPVQHPQQARDDLAAAMGMEATDVRVNVTLLGGGFGRKSKADFATEAALLSKMAGVPVRMQWTREDDIRHSFYHTVSAERIEVSVDESNKVTGWRHNSVAPSLMTTFAPDTGYQQFGIEPGMGLIDVPFDIANISCENGQAMAHTRLGWFRSVSNNPRAWAIGSFVSELASELGKDELTMWKELIGAPRTLDPAAEGLPDGWFNYGEPVKGFEIKTGRLLNCLEQAADSIGYGKPLPEGEGIGLAAHRSFVSYCGAAARVTVVDGEIRVPEVHVVLDAGFVANPERVESQIQGAVIQGMSNALHSGITFTDGAVDQTNYYDYDVVRSPNFPVVTTILVEHPFSEPPTGVGEPCMPPISPAIANGLFHATGKRNRHIPMGPNA